MRASDIMTSPVVTVRSRTLIPEATRLLIDEQVAALPVIAGDHRLVGIVSESDLFRARALDCGFGLGGTVRLRSHQIPTRVVDIMERDVLWVNAADTLDRCVALMMRHAGRSLPVLRHGVLVGIVSRRDVLGALVRPNPDQAATPSVRDSRSTDAEVLESAHAEARR